MLIPKVNDEAKFTRTISGHDNVLCSLPRSRFKSFYTSPLKTTAWEATCYGTEPVVFASWTSEDSNIT